MKDKRLLEEICEDCHKYCILKEVMLHTGMNERQMMQFKMIEKFKLYWSSIQGADIGWEGAAQHYVSSGLAKEFAKKWSEDAHVTSLYYKLKNWYDANGRGFSRED